MTMVKPDRPSASETEGEDNGPIVFYDGSCGLCNRFVQFVLDRDPRGRVRLAPLQGETYAPYRDLAGVDDRDPDSIVLVEGPRVDQRSSAVLRTLLRLRMPWPLVGRLGLLLPRPLRDGAYHQIARRRYLWFGPAKACRLPTPEERRRLLP